MLIKDFTDNTIRLGEFPACIDVRNIPGSHSNDGVLCNVYSCEYCNKTPLLLLIKNSTTPYIFHLLSLSSEEQFKQLPHEIKNGEVLFSSDQTFIERLKTI